jgi:NADPH-dependent 2,4-dienoyl-CoA reductase/sulfur reductase-like enzyme
MSRIMIVGGSDAGFSAALRVRELDFSIEVTVLLRDPYPNFSICGLPYLIDGQVRDQDQLAHRSLRELQDAGLEIFPCHTAVEIDPVCRTLEAIGPEGEIHRFSWDGLILATGARPLLPSLPGNDRLGVFPLRTMRDAVRLQGFLELRQPRRAVIVGGGYIALEMAEALWRRGLQITLLEQNPALLATVHPSLSEPVELDLRRRGIWVHTGVRVVAIDETASSLRVWADPELVVEADLVLLAVGVIPQTELARRSGLPLGAGGAMVVNRRMETPVAGIWAAGDGVETYHRLLDRNVYLPLGSTAHHQGRIAGENALGGERIYAGSLGTQVVQVFDRVIARTGLRAAQARSEGLPAVTVPFHCPAHKDYLPGAGTLHFRLCGDPRSSRLLGAQVLGPSGQEVSKRLDVLATALFHGMTMEGISDLDLSYTPPLSSPWDPLQMASQHWSRTISSVNTGGEA